MTALNGSTTRMGDDNRSFSHDNTSSWGLPHVSTSYNFSRSAIIVVIKLSLILNYLLLHVWWLPQISSKPILDNKHYLRFLQMRENEMRCSPNTNSMSSQASSLSPSKKSLKSFSISLGVFDSTVFWNRRWSCFSRFSKLIANL